MSRNNRIIIMPGHELVQLFADDMLEVCRFLHRRKVGEIGKGRMAMSHQIISTAAGVNACQCLACSQQTPSHDQVHGLIAAGLSWTKCRRVPTYACLPALLRLSRYRQTKLTADPAWNLLHCFPDPPPRLSNTRLRLANTCVAAGRQPVLP